MYKDNTSGGVCQGVDGRDFGSLDNISIVSLRREPPRKSFMAEPIFLDQRIRDQIFDLLHSITPHQVHYDILWERMWFTISIPINVGNKHTFNSRIRSNTDIGFTFIHEKNYGPHYGHQLDNPLDGGDRPSVFREPQLWSDTDGGNHCPSSFSYI